MTRVLKIFGSIAALVLLGYILLHTGLARRAFFELFAYVKEIEVLGPTTVREPPSGSPYEKWLERAREEIPVLDGLVVDDIARVGLKPWPQLGAGISGLYLRLADYQTIDGRIIEIPAGGSTASQRYLYEQGIYFVSGGGYTLIQQEGMPEQRVKWKQGDLLAVPLNVRYQHFASGDTSARMLVVSSFPLMLNVMDSEAFINDNPFVFAERYDGAPDYFTPVDADDIVVTASFAENIRQAPLQPLPYRGEGNETLLWLMAGNSMLRLHVSEQPPESFKKAHRHSSDAFILLLAGEGFSVAWPEGAYHDRARVDWKPGTLFVPPTYWYHQHLNTGSTPARYLAINTPALVRNLGLKFGDQLEVDRTEVIDEWNDALERAAREQP